MNSESPRQSVKARRKLKDEGVGVASKYTMAIKQQRDMMRPALSPGSAHSGFMSDDMDQILAPTFSSTGGSNGPDGGAPMLSESNSADSIIRRVELEIAAARKAASGYSSPNNHSVRSFIREEDEFDEDEIADMANILDTNTNSHESKTFQRDDYRHYELQMQMSSDSSKDRALDIIRDEFQEDLDKEEAEAEVSRNMSQIPIQQSPRPDELTLRSSFATSVTLNSPSPKPQQKLALETEEPIKPISPSSREGLLMRNEEMEESNRLYASSPVESTPAEEKKIDSPLPQSVSSSATNQLTAFPRTSPRRSPGVEKFESLPSPIEFEQTNNAVGSNNEVECPADETKENADAEPFSQIPPNPRTPSSPVSSPDRPHRTPTPSTKAQSRDNAANRVNATSPRDPEGNYAVSPRTPPTAAQRKAVRPSARQVGMIRTRELLDNLKEQRESIASRHAAILSSTTSEASTAVMRNPRDSIASSPNFTRAARAKEMMRNSQRNNHRKEVEPVSLEKGIEKKPSEEQIASPSKDAMNVAKRVTIQSPEDSMSFDHAKESPRRSAREVAESISKQSSKIRFRNPFPVIKPPMVRREAEAIIAENSMGLPEMPVRWVRPKKELRQLIVAAMGTSLPRRSNACGALKVLTKNKKNQMTLVRTDGFLGALIFAATQSISNADRDLAIDARTRAVSCLKNVCDPKDNRVIVFNHPGVMECLIKVIKCDTGEGRAMAAAAFALLAKTPGCREGLAHSEEVIEVLAQVLKGVGVLLEEDEAIAPLCPSPSNRKLDDDVSAYSDRSRGDRDDGSDDEETDDNESLSEASSASSPRKVSPPSDVVGPREIKHVDSIKTQTEERQTEFALLSRSNACAALLHLSKHCAVSVSFLKSVSHVNRVTFHSSLFYLSISHSNCSVSTLSCSAVSWRFHVKP